MAQGKEHIATDENKRLVKNLAAVGIRYVDIAQKLDIKDDTLVKYYKKELEEGRIDANAAIGQTLFQQAKDGNTSAAIFWLKTRAGWKETQVNEITGAEGSPLNIGISFVTANSSVS